MTETLWPLAAETMQALSKVYRPLMDTAAADAGLDMAHWTLLLAAHTFNPDPISTERLQVRNPYTAAQSYAARLALLAERGYLDTREDAYLLAATGERQVRHVIDAAHILLAALAPMSQGELRQLALLLQRLVEASMAAPPPPDKWSLSLSRRTDPGPDAPPLVRIDQYLADLSAYRDDAHLAAWRPYDLDGPAWEALTLLWRDQADSPESLYRQLAHRGHSLEVYGRALCCLGCREWVEVAGSTWRLTRTGQIVRHAAETATDRFFYFPWRCLRPEEAEALAGLLAALRDGLCDPSARKWEGQPHHGRLVGR